MRANLTPAKLAREREPAIPWLHLLANTQVQGLVSAKFLSDAAWYFYLFWLPKYLYDARGFDTRHVGYYAWIPYAASGVGSIAGGWFSSRLIQRGHSVNFARKVALGASAALMPWIFFVTHAPVHFAIVLFSMAFFGQQSWLTLVVTLPTDLFPGGAVGSVAGLVGFGGSYGRRSVRLGCGIPARSWIWIRTGLRAGEYVSCGGARGDTGTVRPVKA